MPPPYRLGLYEFPTKAHLTSHFRAVRDATPLHSPIADETVLRLLRMHPQWGEKSAGMTAVTTAMIKGSPAAPPSKQIAILRSGGDVMDISWTKLISRLQKDGSLKHPSDSREALDELRIVARQLIEPQVAPLRQLGMHVDHVHPQTFEALLFNWVCQVHSEHGLKVVDLKVVANDGPIVLRSFVNGFWATEWTSYHHANALLEVITPQEHASRPKVRCDWGPYL